MSIGKKKEIKKEKKSPFTKNKKKGKNSPIHALKKKIPNISQFLSRKIEKFRQMKNKIKILICHTNK